ncbi:hypothetical protein [Bradyrhizobium sp. SYSU BS000235]|uniref:hypothetical protein n=1 Tax=Bradyrhizobium sp. SYSU BS000235 TaxID=3411332 RepID=UPI003C7131A0
MNSLFRIVAFTAILPPLSLRATRPPQQDCNEENMSKASAAMDTMPGGEKKATAVKELDLAKEMMAKKDISQCKTHLNNALKIEVEK